MATSRLCTGVMLLAFVLSACIPEDGGGPTHDLRSGPEAEADMAACMAEAGYPLDEYGWPYERGEQREDGSFWRDLDDYDPGYQSAFVRCMEQSGIGERPTQSMIAESNRQVIETIQCMRERGWDVSGPVPLPEPNNDQLTFPPGATHRATREEQEAWNLDLRHCAEDVGYHFEGPVDAPLSSD